MASSQLHPTLYVRDKTHRRFRARPLPFSCSKSELEISYGDKRANTRTWCLIRPDVDRVLGSNGETFGEFSERITAEHYEQGIGM